MHKFSRRDFIKAVGSVLASAVATRQAYFIDFTPIDRKKNIIIILCDAFSAKHLSLYGYARQTTPHIDSFAEYSTVFHNHYSGGNFTTTGTASMLTGMNAWKHRAINYAGLVKNDLININPYSLLKSDYYTFAFCQNVWPSRLISQYIKDVDKFLPPSSYSMLDSDFILKLFNNDRALASIALEDFMLADQGSGIAGSSLLGYLNKQHVLNFNHKLNNASYPDGFPEIMPIGHLIPYRNEEVYDGVFKELNKMNLANESFFAYFHLWSPHFPYRPKNSYKKLFNNDGYIPTLKPPHPLTAGLGEDYMLSQRTHYDRQIAQVDDEFGKLISDLDKAGILENSYIIFTSDHGEMFERGFVGHGFQMMYEPVLQVPLIVHAPDQTIRKDIYTCTSNIDILPTVLAIAGKDIPKEIDGQILPGLGGVEDLERPIFSMVATDNSAFEPIKKGVIAMRKNNYKLIAYFGYDQVESNFELYNLENDPDELINLVKQESPALKLLKDELLENLELANQAYKK